MRVSWCLACVVGTVVIGSGAHAQAPRITERGDPSVRDDTIYRLAVDSAAYPEQSTVLLFSDGVVRIDGGRATRTWRTVTQVLREHGAKPSQERQFTYSPQYETLTINWMRVVKPDGTVISARPSQMQEGAVAASPTTPTNRRVVRASLSGIAPGTIVDISWTAEQRVRFRDFYQTWRVTAGTTVRRSRLLIDVPEDMTLRFVEHNLNFPRRETVVGHRMVYEWATAEVPWVKPEAYAPQADSNDQGMVVTVSTPGSWSDVGRWYAGVVRGRFRATSRLRDTVARLVAHAATHEDSIKAVHRWVAQGVRSVIVSFGIGGYRPRSPDDVMSTGFGDSGDKTALFIAALGVIGVDAYPVLIDASGASDRDLPTMSAFNHEIAAIKQPSGYAFVDPTADLTPFGALPYSDQGQFGLVVHPDGGTDEITTPPGPIDANETTARVVGVLDSSGAFRGRADVGARGAPAAVLRVVMQQGMDSTQRVEFLRDAAEEAFPNATGDSLVTFDGKDLDAEARVVFVIRSGRATQRTGTTDILVLRDQSTEWGQAGDALEAQLPRRMPIDAARVFGPMTTVHETRITLPAGWRARLPSSVTATSVFGTYESTYRQDGRDLIIMRRTSGARGIVSKDHVGELIAWFRAVAKDRVPFIVIDHS